MISKLSAQKNIDKGNDTVARKNIKGSNDPGQLLEEGGGDDLDSRFGSIADDNST